MEKKDLDLAGAVITSLEQGELPSVVTPDLLESFKEKIPQDKLKESVEKYINPSDVKQEKTEIFEDPELLKSLHDKEQKKETPVDQEQAEKSTQGEFDDLFSGIDDDFSIEDDSIPKEPAEPTETQEIEEPLKDSIPKESVEPAVLEKELNFNDLEKSLSSYLEEDVGTLEEVVSSVEKDSEAIKAIKSISEFGDLKDPLDKELEAPFTEEEVDSEDLFQPPKQEASRQDDDDHKKALTILQGYTELNQKIIYKSIVESSVSKGEIEIIEKMILGGTNEEDVVKSLFNFLKDKKDAVLIDTKLQRQAYYKSTGKELLATNLFPLIRMFAIGIVVLIGIFFLYQYANKYIRANQFYEKGLDFIEEDAYLESNDMYQKAVNLWPNIEKINEYANKYISLGRFYDAQKKYEDALKLKPNHYLTKLNFAKMYVIKKDYQIAEDRFKKMTERHPKKIKILEEMGELYLDWGNEDRSKFRNADATYNLIMANKGPHAKYFVKKMHLEAKRNNYLKAKIYYNNALILDPKFINLKSHGIWVDYLQNIYNNFFEPKNAHRSKYDQEQLFIVRTINELTEKIYQKDQDHFLNYYYAARWNMSVDSLNKAEKFAKKGVELFEKKGGFLRFDASKLYNILGMTQYKKNNIIEAVNAFQTSLDLNPSTSLPNYYMGHISFHKLGNFEKAKEYFNTAKLYWKEEKNHYYDELLYSLGYVYYQEGLDNKNFSSESYREAFNYWQELSDRYPNNYLSSYVSGLAYLSLKEYDLAEAQFRVTFDLLKRYINVYKENGGSVAKEIKQKVEVLTDLYNNIAIAQMGKSYQNIRPVYNRQKSLKNLINAISLKDQMGLTKGIPIANYNLINHSKNTSINNFIIANNFLPKVFNN